MPESRSLKVFFFGDSICFGQGVSPHHAWVTRVGLRLAEVGAGRSCEITVQNPSVNGNTTRQALERMAYDVQAHEPDVLAIQFGMNDCNGWTTDRGHSRVSAAAFVANLSEMIDRAQRFKVRRLILLTNHPTGRDRENLPYIDHTYEASNRRYNELVRGVATNYATSVKLIDIERAFLSEIARGKSTVLDFLLSDALRLGVKGHDLYFATVSPVVDSLVAELLQ